MKIKLWQLEYDFDKEDAKIVVPLILLLLGLIFTQLRKDILLGDVTGEICTKWNERESTWRKSWSCQSRGTSQSKS